VSVPAGSYDIKYTVAGQPPGSVPLKMFATLEKTCDGAKQAYYVDNFFNTGNYAWFKDVVAGRMTFPGGLSTVRICFETVSYFNFKGFSVTAAGSQPFNGQRQAVPGTVVAQKFDAGGQNVAYFETRWTGTPRVRPSEGVNGQWNCISYIDQGEWVKYSVQVAGTGSYNVEYLLAANPPAPVTSSMYLVIDGECSNGPQVARFSSAAFSTWSWEPAKAFGTTSVFMTAGAHTLSVCFEAASWVNFYGLNLIAAGPNTGSPYNGVRQLVPGLIKAPLFDAGAEGTAYHDVSTSGTLLRAGAKVGGEATNVGYIVSGEWIRYSGESHLL
jgi:Carbohydrate binding module (family 6)